MSDNNASSCISGLDSIAKIIAVIAIAARYDIVSVARYYLVFCGVITVLALIIGWVTDD